MKKIQTQNPEWYKVGYLFTSWETDEVFIIKAIEVRHEGLSFPVYYLHCHPTPGTVWNRLVEGLVKFARRNRFVVRLYK